MRHGQARPRGARRKPYSLHSERLSRDMTRNRNQRKSVPVSKLAWYAAAPEEFRRYSGGTRNVAAAQKGQRSHENFARPRRSARRFGLAVLIAFIVAAGLLALLRI